MQALHYLSQQPVDSRAGSPGIYSASPSYGVGRRLEFCVKRRLNK